MSAKLHATQNLPLEFSLREAGQHDDAFNELEVDVLFEHESGGKWKVPAYWAGDGEWRVRFSPPTHGEYEFASVCSDGTDEGLNGRGGEIHTAQYAGDNPLLQHGFLRIGEDGRHFEHADGTPFFWLGDTWWMGLCHRISWPDEFQLLAADRRALGFTVIQIIAGLYPDMPPFDERGANEVGYPWEREYLRINPSYFDMADLRIQWLARSGLVPCIVGCWGYFLPWMGVERMKKHWRNLVARYGAYPVVWCLAGEATMPYYLSETKEEDRDAQKKGWTEIAEYVREVDPFRHPVTIHPTNIGRDQVEDPSLLDFDMLQTGHSDRKSVANHLRSIRESMGREPRMPVLVGEVCYEGILEACRPEIQRYMFWSAMLEGTAGHTYGANGIWQLNRKERPFGPSPHGFSWGNTPWDIAYRLPGSRHLAQGKRILEGVRWWMLEPHPEWVDAPWSKDDDLKPLAAGIPGELRVVYLPNSRQVVLTDLEPDSAWESAYIDPKDGKVYEIGVVRADAEGRWQTPNSSIFQDWVLTMTRS
jgi:hypothetical protein